MGTIFYKLDVLASKTERRKIKKLLTGQNNSMQPCDEKSPEDNELYFLQGETTMGGGLREISEKFPAAIFLLEETNRKLSWIYRKVCRNGCVIRSSFYEQFGGRANSVPPNNSEPFEFECHWLPINTFKPFEFEYYHGLPFGSTWAQFLNEAEACIKSHRAEAGVRGWSLCN